MTSYVVELQLPAGGADDVFRWSPSAWTVLACDDAPSVDLGWEIV